MDKATKEKKLKMLLPILGLISIFVWLPMLKGSNSKGKQSASQMSYPSISDINDLFVSVQAMGKEKEKTLSRYKNWGRSPFVSMRSLKNSSEGFSETIVEKHSNDPDLKEEKVSVSDPDAIFDELVLNGIVWNSKNPSAIINDNVVWVGADIDGFKVLEINSDSVIIINDGEDTYKLGLK